LVEMLKCLKGEAAVEIGLTDADTPPESARATRTF
jgi:hypothetical protein